MESQWILGLAGGLMIGLAAALYLLGNGRIMGTSGILGGLLHDPTIAGKGERALFLAGLIGCPGLLAMLIGAPETHLTTRIVPLVLAGLLVGIGARIANGCTTGHGVCGLARLSTRSMMATGCFIGSGVCTVLVLRLLGS